MNFATTKRRILQFIDSEEITVSIFLKETGIKRGFLDKDKLDAAVSDIFIAMIIARYPILNIVWLITGEGDMLVSQYKKADKISIVSEKPSAYKLRTDRTIDNQTIPIYNIEATAGLITLFDNQLSQNKVGELMIPDAPRCDGAVYVRGDSMYPILKSGDIVCYKTIHDALNVFWGEMYLIDVNMDGEQYITIKYLQKSELGNDYIRLVSHNQHHNPIDTLRSNIKALALVKASVRYNSMG